MKDPVGNICKIPIFPAIEKDRRQGVDKKRTHSLLELKIFSELPVDFFL